MAWEIDIDFQGLSHDAFAKQCRQIVTQVSEHTLAAEGIRGGAVSFLLTTDDAVRSLNRDYRGMDAPTDVLSFPQYDNADEVRAAVHRGEPIILGDIVISWERAQSQAVCYGHDVIREIGFLCVHGLLHLLGYDHDDEESRKQMRSKEESILASLGLER